MPTIDEVFNTMAVEDVLTGTANELLIIDPDTRQISIPGIELTFGVEADAGSERKYFQCPRYVGNGLDLTACFIRVNFRNANGKMDSYLVDDVATDGDNVVFSWLLSDKVTAYKGQVKFVVCVVGPDLKVKWHTTLGTGISLEGLEPDMGIVTSDTADVVAQLISMVEAQTGAVQVVGEEWTANVKSAGETWVSGVKSEGAIQVAAVKAAAEAAESDSVAEIEAKGVNTRNSIPADYTALSEAVDGLTRGRAPGIVCEVADTAVVVNDAADMPMQGLRIFGRTTQDGTPTPEAPVEMVSVTEPVVTVAGKNLINIKKGGVAVGVTETVTNGFVSFSGTASSNGGRAAWKRSDEITLAPGTYNLSLEYQSGVAPTPCLTNTATGLAVQSAIGSFTLTEATRVYFGFNYIKDRTYDAQNVGVRLEVGESGTSYEPFREIQLVEIPRTLPGIPVTSGGNYTDSEGQQWICDEVDLERGVYVQRVDVFSVDGDAVTMNLGNKNYRASASIPAKYQQDLTYGVKRSLCNRFIHEPTVHSDTADIVGYTVNKNSLFCRFGSGSSVTTQEQLNTWLAANPVRVLLPLAVPAETTLTETELAAYRALHSNYPNTTVLNSAGAHMVVKYTADTKLYIDNKIAALTSGV